MEVKKPRKIYPVILAGGVSTLLLTSSRKSYPQQFSKILGDMPLFQETALCVSSIDGSVFNRPIIFNNNNFGFIVAEQLQSIGVTPEAILIEPKARNSSPAI